MALRVYLIGRSSFDAEAFLTFLRHQPATWRRTDNATSVEELVETAGRVCYLSFGPHQSPKSNSEYICQLIKKGHESVLEHVSWTFLLEGVSRAFTHQFVRHRVGFAFSQLSQQYHDETGASFVEPAHLREFPKAFQAWQRAVQAAREAYQNTLAELSATEESHTIFNKDRENLRAIRSIARSVLPNATETKIVVTANARALRYFLRVRGSIPGDSEMRSVAAELLNQVRPEAPSLFFDFTVAFLPDGSPIVRHSQTTDANP